MRILHVASFRGNIGDNASHYGTYKILRKFFNIIATRLEIRKTYQKYEGKDKWYFDNTFAALANTYDLLLIGGGGYLDYFLDNETGTTLNISEEVLNKLKIPILVCSMGAMPRGSEKNFYKARQFLDRFKRKAQILLRNDGSTEKFPDFPQVLDSGFFYENKVSQKGNYIAINVSTDLLDNTELLTDELAYFVQKTKEKIVFVPHIYDDLKAIQAVLEKVPYSLIAEKITIAPYMQGFKGADQLFSIYRDSKQVIATRFHANVCSIAMGVPVVGIEVSPRIGACYKSLGSEAVQLRKGFGEELFTRFGETYDLRSLKNLTLFKYEHAIKKLEAGI